MTRRLRRLLRGWRLARLVARDMHLHEWDMAEYDRIYTSRSGDRFILDGSQGHTGHRGFHHGPRLGCPVCRDFAGDTAELPRRFPARFGR